MRARCLVGALVLVLTGALAACGSTAPVTRTDPGTADPTSSASAAAPAEPSDDEDLAQQKAEAGIAECPDSDPGVAARSDGLPDLQLDCLGGGQPVRLSGLRGTPLVINIWAQWCGPCRQEAPFLASVAHQVEDRDDVAFLGIDFADPRPELAIEFARVSSWQYPQLVDPLSETKADLKVAGIPATVFVAADGEIVHTHYAPFASEAELVDTMKKYLQVSV